MSIRPKERQQLLERESSLSLLGSATDTMLSQLLPKPSNDAEGPEAQVEALLRMGKETEDPKPATVIELLNQSPLKPDLLPACEMMDLIV